MTSPIVVTPPTRAPLNNLQKAIYSFIRSYIGAWKKSPTLYDLVEQLGLRSTDTAREHLIKIARKGWITFDATADRGIALVEAPQQ